ncbi:MAG: hydantoinase/oxoprolinase N-terminal domain-containing protein [Gemmatimonadota bacterium]
MRRVGIDVGGTNTDAVLLRGRKVLAAVKTPTTEDVTSGIATALSRLLEKVDGDPGPVQAVMVGTTHFTNAVVQRRDLEAVAAVRIGLPSGRSLPPMVDWPADLATPVRGKVFMLEGGHEYDGRPLVPFDEEGMRQAAREIRRTGITSVAVSAVFSPLTPECEERAADILREEIPDVAVTLSHDLGRIGLLERENAAILNAALVGLARRTTRAFVQALQESGQDAPHDQTQNHGTLMRAEYAEAFPVYSFSSGPTNSMRGAAFLSGLKDAMVVDVGGTTTDIGHLKAGFPREANTVVEVGGVRTLFRMPDLLSLGLGGGTLVDPVSPSVGPESVGYRLTQEARVFGGDRLTATDVAVAAGLAELGEPDKVSGLDPEVVSWAVGRFSAMMEEGVDRMKIDAAPLPLLAVGGGAFLVPASLPGISEVIRVPHHAVANAVGAAIAQVSGEVDQVFSGMGRNAAVEEAVVLARRRAEEAGADPGTLEVVEVEDLPLAYLPGDARRVRARVVGEAAPPTLPPGPGG